MSRPAVRPNPLDEGVVEQLVARLIAGESMRQICADEAMPAQTMVYQAMANDEPFRSAIARARELQLEAEIDRMIDIADEATPDDVHVAKLRIWARQWRAAKLNPKKYGDKVSAELTGKDGAELKSGTVLFVTAKPSD